MHFIVVGLDFKTAEVSVREKIHFSGERLPLALNELYEYNSIKGCVILSTCNRVEIYASVSNIENGFSDIINFISKFHNIQVDLFLPSLFKKNCQAAVLHLFRVASSLESMVIGEYQIQGQLRCAYFAAQENNTTNSMMNKLFQYAIQIGKKVRSETKIGEGSVSVATLAIQIVKQIFKDRSNFNILLLGAGKISTLTASNFQQQYKDSTIKVANRSKVHATELAEKFNGTVVDYENRIESIIDSDVIIASTSSENYIINKKELIKLDNADNKRMRLFIDLSIPRNVDPEINTIGNCFVYSIDDINNLINSNIDKRTSEINKVETIINEIAEYYYDWYFKQFIVPTMEKFKKDMEIIKQNTISAYETSMTTFNEEQNKTVNDLLDAYSDKIIKIIMSNFRKSNTNENLIMITKAMKEKMNFELSEN